jgi:hypothetical protein
MSPDERTNLTLFLEQLVRARGLRKDPEAERLIEQALALQPDAGYLLVQRALLLEQALEQAKARIASLETGAKAATNEDSRSNEVGALARGWGRDGGTAATSAAPPVAQPPSPGGSWLGQMASAAAGVAAGAFLFQGIENLLSRHGGPGGYLSDAPGEHLVQADPLQPLSRDDSDLQDLSRATNDFDETGGLDEDLGFGDDSEMI